MTGNGYGPDFINPWVCTCHNRNHVVPSLARECEQATARESSNR